MASQALTGKPGQAEVLAAAVSAQDTVIARLSVGEKGLNVPTTPEQAVEHTREFIHAMAIQQGKAQAEVEQAQVENMWRAAVEENLTGSLLTALGFTGLGGAGIAKCIGVYRQTRKAVEDAVQAGDELADAKTPEEIAVVKMRNMKKQLANGTHGVIKKALRV